MPDGGHIVVEIKITPAFGIEHPEAFGALHAQRLLIEQHRSRAERPQTALDSVLQRSIHRGQATAVEGVQRQDFLFSMHRAPSLTGAGGHQMASAAIMPSDSQQQLGLMWFFPQ